MPRSRGVRLLTTLPPIRISPEVGASRPAIIRNSVVLPEPDEELALLCFQIYVVNCSWCSCLKYLGQIPDLNDGHRAPKQLSSLPHLLHRAKMRLYSASAA